MKHSCIIVVLTFLLALNGFAQDEQTLITINKTKVSKAEFERIYKKNNNNLYDESDKKQPKDYIDLYINFKLKVVEAETLKMDTNSVFINELAGYRKDLAAPYLTDLKFNEQLVKELYNRMLKEVNASHILLRVEKNASESEEKTILNKTTEIKKEIDNGLSFEEAAVKYSEDPSAKTNKGNLSYFTAFQMVAPFENAAFTTSVGEISEPVRSSFGYHLIQVHDIRDNGGEVLVAHIMKIFPQGATKEIKSKLKSEINGIYKELQNGADFTLLAKAESDDKRSAEKGGEIPWFAAGRMIKEFAEPAFTLENKGDYTTPIETQFGFHIIKKLDFRKIASFENSKEDIENRIKKDPLRSTSSKKAFIDKLKKEYNFNKKEDEFLKIEDKNIGDKIDDLNFGLFNLDGKEYSFEEFQNYLQHKKITSGKYTANFEKWVEYEITNFENSKLEEKYPDFRYLMKEYYDGILLFNISEDKIWNYAVKDSAGLQTFYANNSDKYLWKERFSGSIIICKNKDIKEEAEKFLANKMTNEEVIDQLNADGNSITIEKGAWEKGNNPIVDYFVWNKKEPEIFDSETTFIRGDKIPPEAKNLDEARGLYISDYQNYLEQNWIKELRKKYKIKINKKLLKTVEGV